MHKRLHMLNTHFATLRGDTTPAAGYRGGKPQHDPSSAAGVGRSRSPRPAARPPAPLVSAPAQTPRGVPAHPTAPLLAVAAGAPPGN